MLGPMLAMALGRVPRGKLQTSRSHSSLGPLFLSHRAHPRQNLMLLVTRGGEKLPLKLQCSHSAQLCDPPGGNQGGDIASPFLSFKHFW